MGDFHKNIFYYYKGQKDSDEERERQLEDNTTKALINTLELSSPIVSQKFLEFLGINNNNHINFVLQKDTIGEGLIRQKSIRLLLALLPVKGDFKPINKTDDTLVGESRPDAWIYGDNFVVLIESKVNGYINPDQMNKHYLKLYAGTNDQIDYKELTWPELHHFFSTIVNNLEEKDRFIVSQFIQYLEWNSMSDFTGFEKEIFDYFFTRDDEDTRKWARNTLKSFSDKVLIKIKEIDPFYKENIIGNLKSTHDHCWVAFGSDPKKQMGNLKDWAHQTISIYSYGIDIFVNIELQKATDKLKKKLKIYKDDFRNILLKIKSDLEKKYHIIEKENFDNEYEGVFCIRIAERKPRFKNGIQLPRQYDYFIVANFESTYLSDPLLQTVCFDYIEKLIEQINLPYFSLRTRIGRSKVIELSKRDQGDSLINEIINIMKVFHPLVKFVNE